jgi:pantothenate kinase
MTFDDLVARARRLAGGPRRLLGLVGAPGAGKSTLAARLVDALTPVAVLVPMDGFHLADTELDRLGRRDRKGAPDTFDAAGYVALLHRCATPAPTRCTRRSSTGASRRRSPGRSPYRRASPSS